MKPVIAVYEGIRGDHFLCDAPFDSTNYQWMVNGSLLDSLNLTNAEVTHEGVGLLFQEVPLEFNGTTVQCSVILRNGDTQTSNTGTLLVQGSQHSYSLMHLINNHTHRGIGCR